MRITPAYAGNTQGELINELCDWDHPRLRGEHLLAKKLVDVVSGSPPPTRGTQTFTNSTDYTYRITPAYAGNTSKKVLNVLVTGDHPRLRGEHFCMFPIFLFRLGSPPPTRGTLRYTLHDLIIFGITPAYAGNTQ